MNNYNVGIIGGGIFGAVIAKKLTYLGINCVIIDNNQPLAGSKPAACLMKPSWYSSLGPEVYKPSLELLHKLYEVKTINFKTAIASVPVKWINPKEIVSSFSCVNGEVIYVGYQCIFDKWQVFVKGSKEQLLFSHLVICAGVWTNEILKSSNLPLVEGLAPRTGTAFLARGQIEPKIALWRPYNQNLTFNYSSHEIWVGDGTAVKNYTSKNIEDSKTRCAKFIDMPENSLSSITGHRPYVANCKPCYLQPHADNLWVVTGGAKNGTIAAGWAAYMLGKYFQ